MDCTFVKATVLNEMVPRQEWGQTGKGSAKVWRVGDVLRPDALQLDVEAAEPHVWVDALIGPDAPARRRLFMSAFSESLRGVSVPAEVTHPPDPAISWRLDLRLEDTFVQAICAQMGRSYDPVATVLAKFISSTLASFVEKQVPCQQVTHQHPESPRLD